MVTNAMHYLPLFFCEPAQ